MSALFRSVYYEVREDAGPGAVRVARLQAPFPRLEDFQAANEEVRLALERTRARRLLLDLRDGPPGRNDPAFERAGESWRRDIATRFERAAILVRTAAGRLQVARLAKAQNQLAHVFIDEAEALRYLAG